jgi:hypothetical protein
MKIDHRWVAVVISLTGCTSSKRPVVADSSRAPVPPVQSPAVSAIPTKRTADCPHDGKWALCSIERRLTQAGFDVKRVEENSTRRAGFSVTPVVYTLGRSRLEIFLYQDSASLARDIAKLDTLTAGPVGKLSQWGDVSPTLLHSANMAAVILSESPTQTERAILALTAGPPQPGSPR